MVASIPDWRMIKFLNFFFAIFILKWLKSEEFCILRGGIVCFGIFFKEWAIFSIQPYQKILDKALV